MSIKCELERKLAKVFGGLGFNADLAVASVGGIAGVDFQCNACFSLAKTLNANPNEIAQKIAAGFNANNAEFAEAAAQNGFINFTLQNTVLRETAAEIINARRLPLATIQKQTVFFDYGGANVAKELHIGHLRSPIIGEALKRVFEAFGCKTIMPTKHTEVAVIIINSFMFLLVCGIGSSRAVVLFGVGCCGGLFVSNFIRVVHAF
jgi:arginyl-tRNA synthetase